MSSYITQVKGNTDTKQVLDFSLEAHFDLCWNTLERFTSTWLRGTPEWDVSMKHIHPKPHDKLRINGISGGAVAGLETCCQRRSDPVVSRTNGF